MTIDNQIRDKKLQYDINRQAAKISDYHQVKFINTNILLVKIYYHQINSKKLNKQNLVVLLWEKLLKNK